MKLKPILDHVLCTNGDFGESVTAAGVIIQKTIGTSTGITPRWFQVYAAGPDATLVKPGQWVLVEYGRWTESFLAHDLAPDLPNEQSRMWQVEYHSILMVSDEKPPSHNVAGTNVVTAPKKIRSTT